MSEGINLINVTKNENNIVPIKRLQLMRLFAMSLLFIVSMVSIILFLLVALSPLPELKRQEQALRNTLSKSHTEMGKLMLIDERLTSLDGLLKQRKSLDTTISLLQSKMTSDIKVTALRVDKDMITLTVSSKSLQSLDSFLNGLMQLVQSKQGFSRIMLNDLSTEDIKNTYSVTVNLLMI